MKTKIRGIDFGPIVGASGVQGIFGEGYPHHKYFRMLFPGLFTFESMGFVAKTVTLNARLGNMDLEEDGLTPKEPMPRCIERNFRHGAVLNAVGLSNYGVKFYLRDGRWQRRTSPFMLSFMAVGDTPEEQRYETRQYIDIMKLYLPDFRAPVGVQFNYSCPNVKKNEDKGGAAAKLKEAVWEDLDYAGKHLNVALMPKFNALLPIKTAVEISGHTHCDALCVSNTIPWGELPDRIPWKKLFGSEESPLAEFGGNGGGLSGSPITEIVREWVEEYNRSKWVKPLCAGGGVMSSTDVRNLLQCHCVASVFVGSAAILRPWRMKSIITTAHGHYN